MELLAVDRGTGWRRVDWAARKHWIDARFCHRSGGLALLRLYPPGRTLPVPHQQTAAFTLALMAGRGEDLLPALAEHLARHEHRFVWERPAPPAPEPVPEPRAPPRVRASELDVEDRAYALGLKPGLRLRCDPDGLLHTAWLRREDSAMVLLAPLPGDPLPVLMIARTPAHARAMAEAHLEERHQSRRRNAAGTRALGRLLGYPACCVEAFIAGFAAQRPDDLPQLPREAVDVWRRLERSWIPRPRPRLNGLLFGECLRLLSYDPCRLDCPAALAQADQLHAIASADDPEAAAELDRLFARPVFVDASDRRAWIELDDIGGGESRIRAVEPIRNETQIPADERVREQLLGLRVDADGRVPELCELPARVFRFDLGATAGRSPAA